LGKGSAGCYLEIVIRSDVNGNSRAVIQTDGRVAAFGAVFSIHCDARVLDRFDFGWA
jgi:hypothetical protein